MTSLVRKSPQNFLATRLDDELILVHGKTGAFFSIKDHGLDIWEALDETGDLGEIAARMCRKYEVEPAVAEQDVGEFASSLVEAGFATFH